MNYAQRRGKQFFIDHYIDKKLSINQIANIEKTTSTTIRKALAFHNIESRQKKDINNEEICQIKNMISNGVSITDISKQLHLHPGTIRKYGLDIPNKLTSPYSKEQLHEWFVVQQLSGPDIAKMLNVNSSTVYNWLKCNDMSASSLNIPFYNIINRDELFSLYYDQNLSTYDIAKKYNVDVQKVVYALNYHQIEIRPVGWKNIVINDNKYPNMYMIRNSSTLKTLKQTLTNEEISKQLNVPINSVQYYAAMYNIPSCSGSSYERMICEWLTEQNIDFITNSAQYIKPYQIDIYLPKYNIGIEINGCYFHSVTTQPRIDINYHKRKSEISIINGIRLIHCWDIDLADPIKCQIIKNKILNKCGLINNKVFARKCQIVKNVSPSEQRKFFDTYHIQGYASNKITYGLMYDNNLVALLGMREISEGVYDLNRYCTSMNVVGGFQKLLKRFKDDYENWCKIETYANMLYTTSLIDNVYTKSNFTFVNWSSPNYFYAKGLERKSRQQCMKHKLSWLPNFDPTISETMNMTNNGWYQVYDSGHAKYELINQ